MLTYEPFPSEAWTSIQVAPNSILPQDYELTSAAMHQGHGRKSVRLPDIGAHQSDANPFYAFRILGCQARFGAHLRLSDSRVLTATLLTRSMQL